MTNFATIMHDQAHQELSDDAQKKAGKAMGSDMSDEHKNFTKTISALLEEGKIDVLRPQTFLNQAVYQTLPEEVKGKVDLLVVNMATLLSHIYDFYKSKETPDACPQLATMIEQLWEMKERIEKDDDVFVF